MSKNRGMLELIKYLNKATEQYERGTPIMTDKEWDTLYFELVEMEKRHGYVLPGSPTQQIAFSEKVSKLEKITHNHPMLSLAKTKTIIELEEFLGDNDFVAMCKMDGLTCSLRYVNGQLISAETRGNGEVGENIFHNALRIPSIPKYIDEKGEVIVDGEIICTYDDFKPFADKYKNPRNFAAGSIRLLDAAECEKRKLTFIAWDMIKGFSDAKRFSDKLYGLLGLGFKVVPFGVGLPVAGSLSDIIYDSQKFAKKKGFPIDGIVFKFNDLEYGDSLGRTAHHFNNAIAYKFYDEEHETILQDIEWTMGRTGVLTPVAIVEPIEIDGTTIERASLHNISIMDELSGGFARKGDIVSIYKANQIIPQINKWEHVGEYDEDTHIPIPEECPICGWHTDILDTGNTKFLTCVNPACSGKLINRLDHFCGKKGLDIRGLSKATLEKLINWGWVLEIESIFNLEKYADEWKKKPGFGEKSVNNILSAINNAKRPNLEAVLASIGIPLIGRTIAKDLANRFKTYEEFRNKINEGFDFSLIHGYGPEMREALLTFDYSELDKIVEKHLDILNEVKEPEDEDTAENNLVGYTFVITGKLNNFKNRTELKNVIESRGGKVRDSITALTSYLINNDINSTSAKNKKAKELEVEIITEENFIKIFDI